MCASSLLLNLQRGRLQLHLMCVRGAGDQAPAERPTLSCYSEPAAPAVPAVPAELAGDQAPAERPTLSCSWRGNSLRVLQVCRVG